MANRSATPTEMLTNRIFIHAVAANRPSASKAEIARELGIASGYFHAIMNLKNELKFSTLSRFLDLLGVAEDAIEYIRLLTDKEVEALREAHEAEEPVQA